MYLCSCLLFFCLSITYFIVKLKTTAENYLHRKRWREGEGERERETHTHTVAKLSPPPSPHTHSEKETHMHVHPPTHTLTYTQTNPSPPTQINRGTQTNGHKKCERENHTHTLTRAPTHQPTHTPTHTNMHSRGLLKLLAEVLQLSLQTENVAAVRLCSCLGLAIQTLVPDIQISQLLLGVGQFLCQSSLLLLQEGDGLWHSAKCLKHVWQRSVTNV